MFVCLVCGQGLASWDPAGYLIGTYSGGLPSSMISGCITPHLSGTPSSTAAALATTLAACASGLSVFSSSGCTVTVSTPGTGSYSSYAWMFTESGGSCGAGDDFGGYTVVTGCGTGYTDVSGECVASACASHVGESFNAKVYPATSCTTALACFGAAPQFICYNGCRGAVQKADCTGFTLADGTQVSACDVVGTQTTTACDGADKVGTASLSSTYQGDGSNAQPIVSGGGAGIRGGGLTTSGQSFNERDALNLARLATNTDRIASAAETSAGAAGAAVVVDEGSTGTTASGTAAGMATDQGAMEGDLNTRRDAITTAAAPTVLPGGGRWLWSVTSFLPSPSCEYSGSMALGALGTVPYTFSVCTWGSYVQDFAYWAMAIFTSIGVWLILFRRGGV